MTAHEPIELDELPEPADHGGPPLDVLLVCDDRHPANVVKDHIGAFKLYSRNRIHTHNPLRERFGPADFIGRFDAVIVHYSIITTPAPFHPYLGERDEERIRRFAGLKLQIMQDEYRWIDRRIDQAARLGIHVLVSAMRPHNIRRVYGRPELANVLKFGTLSGYVPEYLERLPAPPIRGRPLHVSYRAREIQWWLGRLAHQKNRLADEFPAVAARHGLSYDISGRETDRFYGSDWISFLRSSKAMLGTEGGASIFDFDGEIERRARAYLARHPGADFEALHRDVLAPFEGNVVHRALTPRIFEGAALKCALVMTTGEYAGVLQPGRHYIALEPDLSNADEVARLLKDDGLLQEMADRTHAEIIASGRYAMRRFIAGIDRAIALAHRRFAGASWAAPHPPAARRPARRIDARLLRYAVVWQFPRYWLSRRGLREIWLAIRIFLARTPAYRPYSWLKAALSRAFH